MPKAKPITAKMILDLVKQQNYRCALSGRLLTPETASIDHIVPLSRGGQTDMANLWIVDHQVNSAKGTLMVDEFVRLCHEVTDHHASRLSIACSLGTSNDHRGE